MRRRTLIATMAATPFMAACRYDRFFDLEWDEEIQLHDGRVIVVHIKHRYMRIEQGLTFYSGTSIPIDSTLTLDTGSTEGTVVQYFKGFHPIFLDQHEGTWYGVLRGKYYPGSRETPDQDWGDMEGPSAQWAIQLVGGKWQPISMGRLPATFTRANVHLWPSPAGAYAPFNGKKMTLQNKTDMRKKYPVDDIDILHRPNAYSAKRPDSILPTK